ncbi:MAG: sugar phosphate nucleotidyltransferase [Pseudomonadota bacterium]
MSPISSPPTAPPTKIHPLIICGGTGTRLWPLSRTASPKQFQRVSGPDSLTFFQAAVQRHRGAQYHAPCIVTGEQHRGTVAQQLREIQSGGQIICEPMGRNTGPAVLAAARALMEQDPEAVVVVIPADHVIEGPLNQTIMSCLAGAEAGHIITFGIPPRYAESGFGYILDAGALEGSSTLRRVGSFVEKPPVETAEALIAKGGAYWASGLSMFAAATIDMEYARFDPESHAHVSAALDKAKRSKQGIFLDADHFRMAAKKPTEQAVFEQTDRIALAPLNVAWDDVGSWRAMYDISPRDRDGNVLQGDVITHNSAKTMVRADNKLVSVVGLSDVVVIDTPDALLVAHMDATQNVKNVVETLKTRARPETEFHAPIAPPMAAVTVDPNADALKSDRFNLGTGEIAVGKTLDLPPGPATRQVIIVHGTVHAMGAGWCKTVSEGGRIYGDVNGPIRVENAGDRPVELLYINVEPQAAVSASDPAAPMVSHG